MAGLIFLLIFVIIGIVPWIYTNYLRKAFTKKFNRFCEKTSQQHGNSIGSVIQEMEFVTNTSSKSHKETCICFIIGILGFIGSFILMAQENMELQYLGISTMLIWAFYIAKGMSYNIFGLSTLAAYIYVRKDHIPSY